jgi:NAD(P)-dependent dehydrogenase (short-subunit alcohol dehydrogenase family)
MPNVAIIGASRGIGLEFVRQYAADGWRVYVTTRSPDAPGALGEVRGDVRVHPLDVRNDTHIARFADALRKVALDVLIHNAGVLNSRGSASPEETAETMRINAEAPIVTGNLTVVAPAKAGTHSHRRLPRFASVFMDARLRGHDDRGEPTKA